MVSLRSGRHHRFTPQNRLDPEGVAELLLPARTIAPQRLGHVGLGPPKNLLNALPSNHRISQTIRFVKPSLGLGGDALRDRAILLRDQLRHDDYFTARPSGWPDRPWNDVYRPSSRPRANEPTMRDHPSSNAAHRQPPTCPCRWNNRAPDFPGPYYQRAPLAWNHPARSRAPEGWDNWEAAEQGVRVALAGSAELEALVGANHFLSGSRCPTPDQAPRPRSREAPRPIKREAASSSYN